jgi:hypothetical protein
MGHKREKVKLGDEIFKSMPTPYPFINIQINDVEFCWNIKSMTRFSKEVLYLPGVTGFM